MIRIEDDIFHFQQLGLLNELQNQIKAGLYHKLGKAVTNFSSQLPGKQGKLVYIKRRTDPYISSIREFTGQILIGR